MSTTYIDIVLEGNKFSPKTLRELTHFDLESLAEYGELGQKGRYKGKKLPYGLALLKVTNTSSEDINLALEKVIDDLISQKQALSKSGVDEITLDLENFSQNEVEINIDKEIIKKISELNASIEISSAVGLRNIFISHSTNNKELRHKENYLFYEFYNSIKSDKHLKEIFSDAQSERLTMLFSKKINPPSDYYVTISQGVLMTALFFYIIRYIDEKDFEEIPTFENVVREKYSA